MVLPPHTSSQGPLPPPYNPDATMEKFRYKPESSGHPHTNSRLLNQIDNIEKDATTAAETVTHSRCDNITKAERLAIGELTENKDSY